MALGNEFVFTDRDFNYIRKLVDENTGIVLADAKRQMVYSRLARRLRALGLKDFKSYCKVLKEGDQTEFRNFVNAVTTNLTSFFREQHHFDFLKTQLLPELERKNDLSHRLRIWSAGCSTGEEPYSLAITLNEYFRNKPGWDIKILATDLDTNVLATAEAGIYAAEKIEGLSKLHKTTWFRKGRGECQGKVRVKPELREMIRFRQLNLMHEWPFKGPFDFIFCRNVIIYFSKDTQRGLVDRYANKLCEQGHLFLGHSESLFKVTDRFELIGHTIYRKKR